MSVSIIIPPDIAQCLTSLRSGGFEAYVVGGCVRDSLLGRQPEDWDVTTSATPEETMRVFSRFRTLPTGLKHGTVTVLLGNSSVEITTYRVESAYSDHRHPDAVAFTRSLTDDLRRRDFTVNAMAYAPDAGLCDPFSGRKDLENKCLRCVGNPTERFREDALRILRALRFAAVLGFTVEPATARAMREQADLLASVSQERLYAELTKAVCGAYFPAAAREFPEILFAVIPELRPCYHFDQKNYHHNLDVFEHILKSVEGVPSDPILRYTLLLHDAGKPSVYTQDGHGVGHFYGHAKVSEKLADQALRRLKADTQSRERICQLVREHDTPIVATPACVKRWLNRLGEDGLRQLMLVKRADCLAHAPCCFGDVDEYDAVNRILESVLAEQQCFSLKDLAVSGRDLLEHGWTPGPQLGETLEFLLNEVIEERCDNTPKALLKCAEAHRHNVN